MSELNSCPICGCSVRVWAKRFDEEDVEYIIECDNDFCGLTYGISCGYNRDEIKKAWNIVTASPSTVSEDCISREWVLDKLNEKYKLNRFREHNDKANIGISQAESITEQAPSVTSTERTGEWVEDGYYDSPFRVCSYCGYEHPNQQERWRFCPNCGAKMGGDKK